MRSLLGLSAIALLGVWQPACAQIAVAANDGKQLRPDDPIEGTTPDEIVILDLSQYPPKTLATLNAPASMIGPPGAVAVARDQSFALVTAAQTPNPADPKKPLPADIVSVIDLKDPSNPKVLQTAHSGLGASGVAINRKGTLALVASSQDDALTIFSVKNRQLSPVGKIQLPADAGPTDVAFTPDGSTALLIRRGDHRISFLKVSGNKVTDTGVEMTPGRGPYGVAISPDGRYAFTNNLGGAATRAEIDAAAANPPAQGAGGAGGDTARAPGTVSVIDLKTRTLVNSIEAGATPETVSLSPDGKYLAVVVANRASVQKNAPNYSTVFGLLRIYKVAGSQLTPLPVINNGHWCQGATFSNDSKALLVQCGSERNIEVYRIDGDSVTRDDAATINTTSRGGSIATARSR